MKKDYQRSKVYKWEREFVAPFVSSQVLYENIQCVVDYIYKEERLLNPPKVSGFNKNATKRLGDATRLTLRFHKDVPTETWVIIHETAHSMTSKIDFSKQGLVTVSNMHGPDFVGVYMNLLCRYGSMRLSDLIYSLRKCDIDYNINATPWNQSNVQSRELLYPKEVELLVSQKDAYI